MRRIIHGAALAATLALSGGCVTSDAERDRYTERTLNQKYTLDEVKRRLKDVRIGENKMSVATKLGSPAEFRGTQWVYYPERPGLFLPTEALVVKFEGNRYAGYETNPIVLSEELR